MVNMVNNETSLSRKKMNRALGHFCAHIGQIGPREPPEYEMNRALGHLCAHIG